MTKSKEEDARIHSELSFFSGQISESSRYIGYGLVAFYYGLISASSPADDWLALSIAMSGVATLVFDYLQLICGYWTNKFALKDDDGKRDNNWKVVIWGVRFFWIKQGTAILGAASVAGWAVCLLFPSPPL